MRTYAKPPRKVDIALPKGFSSAFLADLTCALDKCMWNDFKVTYQKESLLSKYLDPKIVKPSLRKQRAIDKWLATELRNSRTNQRLQLASLEDDCEWAPNFSWTSYQMLLHRTRTIIRDVLGPLRYWRTIAKAAHTNGASTRVPRSEMAALHKLMGEGHVSRTAQQHWAVVAGNTRLEAQKLTERESSSLFTVPKRSDIDRVACKEPEINMVLQRSVGMTIRRKLRRHGIDLRDQSMNQRLAANAVKWGLATIDLSSASDCISKQLVFELLPFEWWSLLDDLRCKSTILPNGSIHELEMFSSMGNGFTFELESLIFYAITRAVKETMRVDGLISVYGDDIIAPCAIVPNLVQALGWFGFTTNKTKTFWSGDFRESCGWHFHRGIDVSPIYVNRPVTVLPDLINILNKLLEWSGRGWGFFLDESLAEFHWKYSAYVPRYLWGGVEPDDPTALVTGDSPRHRLKALHREMGVPPEAGLSHWFMMTVDAKEGNPFSVEPEIAYAYSTARCSRGWLTSWRPYLAFQPG